MGNRILIKYPTRGRPKRFLDGLKSIADTVAEPLQTIVMVIADEDDETMNEDILDKSYEIYENLFFTYGTSKSKIDAINRPIPEGFDYDIIVVMSDDMRFIYKGWDEYLKNWVGQHGLDKMYAFYDPDTMGQLNTMYIAGREWVEYRGWIYNPVYVSIFCDNEEMEVAQMLGKYIDTGHHIANHLNPAYGHLPKDDMFIQQQEVGWSIDQQTYNERKARNFDI